MSWNMWCTRLEGYALNMRGEACTVLPICIVTSYISGNKIV